MVICYTALENQYILPEAARELNHARAKKHSPLRSWKETRAVHLMKVPPHGNMKPEKGRLLPTPTIKYYCEDEIRGNIYKINSTPPGT